MLISLSQYVTAVAAEEDNNKFRTYICQDVAARQRLLFSSDLIEITSAEPFRPQKSDLMLVIRFLQWILQPVHRREHRWYPTRSLWVWAIAAAIALIGFEVIAATKVITTKIEHTASEKSEFIPGAIAQVVLVTAQVGETDRLKFDGPISAGKIDGFRAQIMAIRGVPWCAFRQYRYSKGKSNTEYLCDIWRNSFDEAKASVGRPRIDSKQRILLPLTQKANKVKLEFHKSLLRQFSPHLASICGRTMMDFVPHQGDEIWDLDKIYTHDPVPQSSRNEIDTAVMILRAIVLESIYGVFACHFYEGSANQINLDSEIAFRPNILFDP